MNQLSSLLIVILALPMFHPGLCLGQIKTQGFPQRLLHNVKTFKSPVLNATRTDLKVKEDEMMKTHSAISYDPNVPGQPACLTVSVLDSRMLSVFWCEPKETNGLISFYRLTWTWGSNRESQEDVEGSKTSHIAQMPLTPYTVYTLFLTACSQVAKDVSLCGESISAKIRTHTEAPGSPALEIQKTRVYRRSFRVQWKAPIVKNGPLDGYQVHIKSSSDGGRGLNLTRTTQDTCWEEMNLTPWTAYVVSIRAYNIDTRDNKTLLLSQENVSSSTSVRTDMDVPGKPACLEVSELDSGKLRASWCEPVEKNGPITFYRLTWKWHFNQEYRAIVNGDQTTHSPYFAKLPYTDYSVWLVACNDILKGNSLCSDIISAKTRTHTEAPESPELETQKTSVSSHSFRVEWKEPIVKNGPLDGYQVHIKSSSDGGRGLNLTKTTQDTWWEERNLTPWTEYLVSIRAYNIDTRDNKTLLLGRENVTSSTSLKTDVDASSAPAPLTFAARSREVTLSWNQPSQPNGPIDGYYYTYEPCETSCHKGPFSPDKTSDTVSGLTPYTNYTFTVWAFNSLSNGTQLQGEKASKRTTTNTEAPGPPILLPKKTVVTSSSIRVEWKEPDAKNGPLDGYQVHFKPGGVVNNPNRSTNNTWYWEEESLTPWTEYTISVQAFNFDSFDKAKKYWGQNVTTTIKTLVDGTEINPIVTSLTVEKISSSVYQVMWTPPENVAKSVSYNVKVFISDMVHGDCADTLRLVRRTHVVCTGLQLDDLATHSCYYVSVSAVLDGEHTTTAAVKSFRTQGDLPTSPRNLTVVLANSTHVILRWTPTTPNADWSWYNVKLFRSEVDNGNCSRVLEMITSQQTHLTEISYVNLVAGSCYYVSVGSETEDGVSTNAVVTAFVIPVHKNSPVLPNLQEIHRV